MPAQDPFKRFLDTGLEFTEMTRKRAESIVKELVKAGEVQREHTQQRVDELIERSRQASAAFADAVRNEVTRQLSELGLVQSSKKTPAAPATTAPKPAATAAKKSAAKKAPAAKKTAAAAKKTAAAAKKTAKKATAKS